MPQLDDLMQLAEEFITLIVKRCLEKRRPELETIGRDIAQAGENRHAVSRASPMTMR